MRRRGGSAAWGNNMSAPKANSPRAGDIVVYRRSVPAETYLLSIFQHASQLSCCQRDQAMRNAVAFATKDRVDAWYTEDGHEYLSMSRHRMRRSRAS